MQTDQKIEALFLVLQELAKEVLELQERVAALEERVASLERNG